jgi:hypothetical protein
VTRFTEHLRIVTTSNYNAIANLHILHITTAHAKPSQRAFSSRFPVADLNNSSASVLTSLLYGEYPITELNSSQSQNYVTTDGQSASLSWNKAPIWGLRPDCYYCLTAAGLLMSDTVSDERSGLLSFARVTVSSTKSIVSMYNLHFTCY